LAFRLENGIRENEFFSYSNPISAQYARDYLALSFWLINPLTRSTVLTMVAYIFYGYLASTSSDVFVTRRFYPYLYVAAAVFLVLILTVSWGR